MNQWVITTKRGTQALVGNEQGWENFLLNLMMYRAVVAQGVYIGIDEIDSILPAQPSVEPAKTTMAEVLHLVPQPPKGAA